MRDLHCRRSGHRPWVLTDAKCTIGDRDNATTAHAVTSGGSDIKVTFELADPPGVSRCFVHCPGLAEHRYDGDPVVLSSADAFILLVVPFVDGSKSSRGAPSRRSRRSKFGRRGEYNDFFVYRAGPGAPSLCLLPGVGPYCCPDKVTLAGVVPLGGADLDNKDYAVVFPSRSKSCSRYTEYTGRKYNIQVYRSSDISRWAWQWRSVVCKDHNPDIIMRHEGTRVIFAGRATLGWVNHWHGILLCNVLDESPVMRYIEWPVPIPCDLVSRFGMGVDNIYARPSRDVAISNGVIRFVEHKRCGHGDTRNEKGVIGQGWTITTWNRGICSNKWQKRFTVKADNVCVTSSTYPKVSGDKRLSWDKVVHCGLALSLCDEDVVYIMARLDIRHPVAWMLAINIREEALEQVKQCYTEKMVGLEPTYVQCAFSNYLNEWRR